MTKVIHIRASKGLPNEVYIGRAGKGKDGYFGNPVKIGVKCPICGTIHKNGGDTLPCYEKYLDHRLDTDPVFRERVKGLDGMVLVCFCDPNPCHGRSLAVRVKKLAME